MAPDADGPGTSPGGRRPGRPTALAAVLLLVGGAVAVVVGVLGQDGDPPVPAEARPTSSTSPTGTTGSPGAAPVPGPAAAPVTPAPPAATTTPSTLPAPDPVPQPLPVALSVPAIDVASELITVGLRPDGTLEVPEGADYDKAAWFDGSPRPGETGPAVLEGHVDSAENGPSVFYRLGDLRAGDEITVTREDGTAVTFRVDEVRSYPKDDFPTLEVYGNTAGPELRLITCGGDFDRGAGRYVDNTVVFASMVDPA